VAYPNAFTRAPIPAWAVALLVGTLALFAYGIALLWSDAEAFEAWIAPNAPVPDDGLVEWLTHATLAVTALFALHRCRLLRRDPDRPRAWLTWAVLAAAFFFGAMEEISWGQRIFGWKTPGWLCDPSRFVWNRQFETTIHNLVIGGVNVNKLIFSKGLGIIVAVYLLALPVLYRRLDRFRASVDRHAVPIAQNYQVLMMLAGLAAVRASLGIHDRATELLEFLGSVTFFLAFTLPYNAEVFLRWRWSHA
jgi:hypothetical protein